jgi:hypothetical protein
LNWLSRLFISYYTVNLFLSVIQGWLTFDLEVEILCIVHLKQSTVSKAAR